MSAAGARSPRSRFAPLFEEIAAGATERETDRRLAFAEVGALQEAGFGALRVPAELGGGGVSVRQLFELLIELAAADSNFPQIYRAHLGTVEELRVQAARGDERARHWLEKASTGTFFGAAVTEPEVGAADRYRTALTRSAEGWRLNGEKYYSTGSLYADYLSVAADRDGERVSVFVPADAPGVAQRDDWNGFGQRLTASGYSSFVDVAVSGEDVSPGGYGSPGRTWSTAYLQLILLASLAGIAQRVLDDAVEWARSRTRTFSHAPAALPKDDPLVQETVGKLSAAAFGTRAAVLAVADELDALFEDEDPDPARLDAVERSAGQAQDVVVSLTLDSSTRLFELGGASLLASDIALDRHWRNARTLATHNPLIYKLRSIGANLVGGDPLPFQWSAGVRPASRTATPLADDAGREEAAA